MHRRNALMLLLTPSIMSMSACARTYYNALERVGIEKRDILIDRIEDSKQAQDEAKEQFVSALEQFRQLVAFDAGELDAIYDRLDASYEESANRATRVSARIDAVEKVAEDLFDEWSQEIGLYSNVDLARQSKALLRQTRRDYSTLMAAMKRAEAAMQPVLSLFNDQVMFLRHNLNARAVGALHQELASIEEATRALVVDMQRSIEEADRFIASMS